MQNVNVIRSFCVVLFVSYEPRMAAINFRDRVLEGTQCDLSY